MSVGFSTQDEAMDVAKSSQPCGRYLIDPSAGNEEGSKSLMVLDVLPTPTEFPTNMLYAIAFYTRCGTPVGYVLSPVYVMERGMELEVTCSSQRRTVGIGHSNACSANMSV